MSAIVSGVIEYIQSSLIAHALFTGYLEETERLELVFGIARHIVSLGALTALEAYRTAFDRLAEFQEAVLSQHLAYKQYPVSLHLVEVYKALAGLDQHVTDALGEFRRILPKSVHVHELPVQRSAVFVEGYSVLLAVLNRAWFVLLETLDQRLYTLACELDVSERLVRDIRLAVF